MKITAIRLDRMRLPLDPPFRAAWDPVPRRHFDATLVTVHTDKGVTGYGSGDTMDGFEPFEPLFTGRDPLRIAGHVATLESVSFHQIAADALDDEVLANTPRPPTSGDIDAILLMCLPQPAP